MNRIFSPGPTPTTKMSNSERLFFAIPRRAPQRQQNNSPTSKNEGTKTKKVHLQKPLTYAPPQWPRHRYGSDPTDGWKIQRTGLNFFKPRQPVKKHNYLTVAIIKQSYQKKTLNKIATKGDVT